MSDHLDRLEEELEDAEFSEEEIAAAVGRLPISVSEWADKTRAKVLGRLLHAESKRNVLRAERDALDEACDELRRERDEARGIVRMILKGVPHSLIVENPMLQIAQEAVAAWKEGQ